jgi:hypothetical protein
MQAFIIYGRSPIGDKCIFFHDKRFSILGFAFDSINLYLLTLNF